MDKFLPGRRAAAAAVLEYLLMAGASEAAEMLDARLGDDAEDTTPFEQLQQHLAMDGDGDMSTLVAMVNRLRTRPVRSASSRASTSRPAVVLPGTHTQAFKLDGSTSLEAESTTSALDSMHFVPGRRNPTTFSMQQAGGSVTVVSAAHHEPGGMLHQQEHGNMPNSKSPPPAAAVPVFSHLSPAAAGSHAHATEFFPLLQHRHVPSRETVGEDSGPHVSPRASHTDNTNVLIHVSTPTAILGVESYAPTATAMSNEDSNAGPDVLDSPSLAAASTVGDAPTAVGMVPSDDTTMFAASLQPVGANAGNTVTRALQPAPSLMDALYNDDFGWSADEVMRLRAAARCYPAKTFSKNERFAAIARAVGTRTKKQCYDKHQELLAAKGQQRSGPGGGSVPAWDTNATSHSEEAGGGAEEGELSASFEPGLGTAGLRSPSSSGEDSQESPSSEERRVESGAQHETTGAGAVQSVLVVSTPESASVGIGGGGAVTKKDATLLAALVADMRSTAASANARHDISATGARQDSQRESDLLLAQAHTSGELVLDEYEEESETHTRGGAGDSGNARLGVGASSDNNGLRSAGSAAARTPSTSLSAALTSASTTPVLSLTPTLTTSGGAAKLWMRGEYTPMRLNATAVSASQFLVRDKGMRAVKVGVDTAAGLRALLFGCKQPEKVGGKVSLRTFNEEWMTQGLFFSTEPGLQYGLIQPRGGPCGALAALQAEVLRHLFYSDPGLFDGLTASEALEDYTAPWVPVESEECELDPSAAQQQRALVLAIVDMLWRCRRGDSPAIFAIVDDSLLSASARSAASRIAPKPVTVGGASLSYASDGFTDFLKVYTCPSQPALAAVVEASLPLLVKIDGPSIPLLVYSAMLTRGLDAIEADMDVGLGGQATLVGAHNYATQELVNLLLTGTASSNVFDGVKVLEEAGSKLELHGVPAQAAVGFLTLFEAHGYMEVGSFYKSPWTPIWVVCAESHYSVLFASPKGIMYGDEALGKVKAKARKGALITPVTPSACLGLRAACNGVAGGSNSAGTTGCSGAWEPFEAIYFDGLGQQEGLVRLTLTPTDGVGGGGRSVSTRPGGGGKGTKGVSDDPPLEMVIQTRWDRVKVCWNGTEPLL